MDRKKILESILIDEEAIFANLVEKAKKIFGLNARGDIVFLIPRDSLTQRQLVAVYLTGRLFAKELEIIDSEIVVADDLSVFLGTDKKTVAARLHDLKKEHIVESPGRGQFSISISGADKILDEISKSFTD
jgi:hypothetical protein